MRVVNRFIYAIVLALGLYSVFNVTHTRTLINELEVIGQQEIDNNNINAFVTTRFSEETPTLKQTINIEEATFDLYVFEVANIDEQTLDIYSGIQLIMHQQEGENLPLPMTVMINEDTLMMYELVQIVGLPVYTLYPSADETFFTETTYENQSFQSLTFIKDNSIKANIDISVDVDSNQLETQLKSFIETEGNVPFENIEGVIVSDVIQIDTTPQILLYSGLYILVSGIITYILFFRKPTKKSKKPLNRAGISDA